MSRRPARATIPRDAVDHLPQHAVRAAEVIDRVGTFQPSHEPDLWTSLVDSIVGQQLSVKAAATISGRVRELRRGDGMPGPEVLLAAPEEALRGCGLSHAKVRYVKDLAMHWLDGSLHHELLPSLPDEDVIAELTQVKGIGRWTAEMVLIFTLSRPDVLPVDDLGFRVAAQHAYDLPERPGREELTRLGEPWRPYRSAATLYLWQSLKG